MTVDVSAALVRLDLSRHDVVPVVFSLDEDEQLSPLSELVADDGSRLMPEPILVGPFWANTRTELRKTEATIEDGDVKQLQLALEAYGLYQGAVDGQFGPVTEAAVTAFQTYCGLQVSCQTSPRTLSPALFTPHSVLFNRSRRVW